MSAVRAEARAPDARLVRPVLAVAPARHTIEGEGFEVRRALPNQATRALGPFIFLDHLGPQQSGPGQAKGAPDHPHAGIETITYLLEGGVEHRDSLGNVDVIRAGEAQWMTAGRGIVHAEMPPADLLRDGGTHHGVQLWINLPREQKRMEPRYRHVGREDIPVVELGAKARLRLIGGRLGAAHAAETVVPLFLAHATLERGARAEIEIDPAFQMGAYLLSGGGRFGTEERATGEGSLVVFGPGDCLLLQGPAEDGAGPLEVLLLGGAPIRDSIVWQGPFVASSVEEMRQVILDYYQGRMGEIPRQD